MSKDAVILRPRPLARSPGQLVLLPLLPVPAPSKHIPPEIWTEIVQHSLHKESPFQSKAWGLSLLFVSKFFADLALPLVYANIRVDQLSSLQRLYDKLHAADQKWDSLRRIPYSTPGRWIQCLDLSRIASEYRRDALQLDSILTNLFPLLPFLAEFSVNPSFYVSRRALGSLSDRAGSVNLRKLRGLSYSSPLSPNPNDDPFVTLLRQCPKLEELDMISLDLEPLDYDFLPGPVPQPTLDDFLPLQLPKLRILSLLSMHSSPLMIALLCSPLPSLQKLTLTPYDDLPFPYSLTTAFIGTHGVHLRSLLLFTPKKWPTRLHPSPPNILSVAPMLRHLSLEAPVPEFTLSDPHPLQILSIPRPKAHLWPVLERMLPFLPNLAIVRARDIQWLRKGISSVALDTGVQGEMREWRRKLARRRIRLMDANWNEDSSV